MPLADDAFAHVYTYSIEQRGDTQGDFQTFEERTEGTLNDIRGWTLNFNVDLRRVTSGGDFRIVLASPSEVAQADGEECNEQESCTAGDEVLINDNEWQDPPSDWPTSRHLFRHWVINHHVGHWLGLGNAVCPLDGEPARVMLEQSEGLHGCEANAWPLFFERDELAEMRNIDGWPTPPKDAPCSIAGTDAGDRLEGTNHADVICGGAGDDSLVAMKGFDLLRGGSGDDFLGVGAQDDIAFGGPGDDTIFGWAGDDELRGETGEDTIRGMTGNDFLGGGANDDALFSGDGPDRVIGWAGSDVIVGWARRDILIGKAGNDEIRGKTGRDRLIGNRGDDFLGAGDDADEVWGGKDADVIKGWAGDDRLGGQVGNDEIDGGSGNDACSGGAGTDSTTNC